MNENNPKQPVFSPLPPPPVARLKAIKGPYKGTSYKLIAAKITLGRSSENDIAFINDSKCSRKQAVITVDLQQNYSIKDLSKRTSLRVNNMVKLQSKLQDGDLIQFGSTVLQLEIEKPDSAIHPVPDPAIHPIPDDQPASISINPIPAANTTRPNSPSLINQAHDHSQLPPVLAKEPQADQLELKQETPPPPSFSPVSHHNPTPPLTPPPRPRKKKKKSLLPKFILIALLLAGAYLYLEDSGNKAKQQDKLKTIMEKEAGIKTLSELREKELKKRGKNANPSFKNAQFAYIKGVRDYRKGVYSRAIESFRVCKILYPQHNLCTSYLQKAQIKNQQLIQAWMVAGKNYREKRRFVPCMSSFQNVMTATRNKQSLTYKEASENFKICKIQHEDRY